MINKYILSLDQGTTSSRAIIFNKDLEVVSISQKEFTQIYPRPSWVEHDPEEIWNTQLTVAREVLEKSGLSSTDIAAIGITNQRETTLLWDKTSGKPVYNAIVWQCRRTNDFCQELKNDTIVDLIRSKTGLIPDPYFSATKIKWILDNVPGVREKAKNGEILFGTIDTWLLWNLTGGKVHATDYSNASRTMLYNIHTLCWDDELLDIFDIPKSILPQVCDSSFDYGCSTQNLFGTSIPITGIAGDQQAALFGQNAFEKGDMKNTYGTGCFLLSNTGNKPIKSNYGLLTTIAWGLNGEITYALEGSVFVGGAVVQWLRDELEVITSSSDSELEAVKVQDTNGVYFVPAFTGLGAPYWNPEATGAILGLTRGANKCHIIRAALESIAFQSMDIINAMEKDIGKINEISVDGGASKNSFLMQFQSDILNVKINRPSCVELTALGAACLAGLKVGYFPSLEYIKKNKKLEKTFYPTMNDKDRDALVLNWHNAINKVIN